MHLQLALSKESACKSECEKGCGLLSVVINNNDCDY